MFDNSILIEEYKTIYHFVPKAGCSSMKTILAIAIGKNPETSIHELNFDKPEEGYDYSGYFKFTIVRNPYSRILSCYTDKILLKKPDLKGCNFRHGYTFTEFVDRVVELDKLKCNPHMRPQCNLLGGKEVDFVAKLETIDEDWRVISEMTGITTPYFPKINTSSHASVSEYYTDETRDRVYDWYKEDFEMFNYKETLC